VPDVASSLRALGELPGIPERVALAREACERLRWHEALRRRIPEAAAESRVRGAQASAALEGATVPLDLVRDVMRGEGHWPPDPDPVQQVAQGAVRATAESERVGSLLATAPMQALARLHVAAAAGLVDDDQLGRPRRDGEGVAEFTAVGPAPSAADLPARLDGLAAVLLADASVPALVVTAVVHAEVVASRPFVRGNGVVARALARAVVHARGLDPTGVAVVEAGHATQGGPAYLGALAAYATGSTDGVRLWLEHSADAVVAAARAGEEVCDAVRAGRLS
jgi:Fic family protein